MTQALADFETSTDVFLGGQVKLVQPVRDAHRSGSDAVFLAATLAGASGQILDMGAGAGAVGLMAAVLSENARVTLAENDPILLDCAQRSIAANHHTADRITLCPIDLLAPEAQRVAAGLGRAQFDHVLSNPPYRRAGHVRANPAKQAAHVIDEATLDGWVRTAASALKPGGSLTMIFAGDGLTDLLATFEGRFGAATLMGLHPKAGAPAERILVRAVKGRRTRPAILPGLILHEEDGSYTDQAAAILEGRATVEMRA